MPECVFCQLAREPSRVGHRIADSEHALALLDLRPLRRGHSLVLPKRHVTDLSEISPEAFGALMSLVREVSGLLRRRLGTTGENLFVASGPGSEQSVFHLHVHVIPRLPDDDLRWNDWWESKATPADPAELELLARSLRG